MTNFNLNLIGTKELLVGKKFVSTECSSLKRKNNILTNTLHTVDKEKGTPQSRIPLLNGGLHGLQMEKEKVAEPLKGLSTAIYYLNGIICIRCIILCCLKTI